MALFYRFAVKEIEGDFDMILSNSVFLWIVFFPK